MSVYTVIPAMLMEKKLSEFIYLNVNPFKKTIQQKPFQAVSALLKQIKVFFLLQISVFDRQYIDYEDYYRENTNVSHDSGTLDQTHPRSRNSSAGSRKLTPISDISTKASKTKRRLALNFFIFMDISPILFIKLQ